MQAREREIQDQTNDNWKESKKIYAEHTHALRLAALENSTDYGKIFVRFTFLLNGGAIIALLALIGSIFEKADKNTFMVVINFASALKESFYWYVGGLFCTAVTTGLGYCNWGFVFRTYFNEGQTSAGIGSGNLFGGQDMKKELAAFKKFDLLADVTMWLGIIFGISSLLAFVIGSVKVASAFAILGMA